MISSKDEKLKSFLRINYAKPIFPRWLKYPKELNVCEQLLDRNLKRGFGHKVAIRFNSRSISYLELSKLVCSLSKSLLSMRLKPQDRVLIRTTKRPEFIVALLTIFRLGAIAVPTHPAYSQDELDFAVKDSGAKFGIGTRDFLGQLRSAGLNPIEATLDALDCTFEGNGKKQVEHFDIPPALGIDGDSPCLILYTSGTMGRPKGCVHTLKDYLVVSDIYGRKALNVDSFDIVTGPTSLSFAFGHIGMIAVPFRFGATVALFDSKFDPVEFLKNCICERSTIIFAVPSAYRAMLKLSDLPEVPKFSRIVRACVSAGEPCGAELQRNWEKKFKVKILEHLGSTEMLDGFIGSTLKDLSKNPPGSLGKPLPGYQVRFRDGAHYDKEKKMKIGEVIVRGPVTIRYWDRPKEQREVCANGWNRTHDILGKDQRGRYWYISRSDEIIKSAGYRISPHEVEHVLMRHTKVAEVAVIGLPDPNRGNIIAAFIVDRKSTSNVDIQEIKNFAEEHLAGYKVPRLFKIVSKLPKTSTGKISRVQLLRREMKSQQLQLSTT